jgi:hypothetical protein
MPTVTITVDVPDGTSVRVNSSENRPGSERAESHQDDPWGGGQATTSGRQENAPASGSGSSGGNPDRPASGTATDDKGKLWTFGAPNAPDCQCGETAALVKGATNGKPWSQWRCAKSFDDWRNKCQFSQFGK